MDNNQKCNQTTCQTCGKILVDYERCVACENKTKPINYVIMSQDYSEVFLNQGQWHVYSNKETAQTKARKLRGHVVTCQKANDIIKKQLARRKETTMPHEIDPQTKDFFIDQFSRAIDEAEATIKHADNVIGKMANIISCRLKTANVNPEILTQLKRELSQFNIQKKKWNP